MPSPPSFSPHLNAYLSFFKKIVVVLLYIVLYYMLCSTKGYFRNARYRSLAVPDVPSRLSEDTGGSHSLSEDVLACESLGGTETQEPTLHRSVSR